MARGKRQGAGRSEALGSLELLARDSFGLSDSDGRSKRLPTSLASSLADEATAANAADLSPPSWEAKRAALVTGLQLSAEDAEFTLAPGDTLLTLGCWIGHDGEPFCFIDSSFRDGAAMADGLAVRASDPDDPNPLPNIVVALKNAHADELQLELIKYTPVNGMEVGQLVVQLDEVRSLHDLREQLDLDS